MAIAVVTHFVAKIVQQVMQRQHRDRLQLRCADIVGGFGVWILSRNARGINVECTYRLLRR